ncbi:MAG: hypothetical protein IJW20_04770 [Clostridia bacterium]|nr:hypothetical protein [Clostridia bacterium]
MEEKEELKGRLLKLIISNVLIILIMFLIFGLFIFLMVKNTVYTTVDKELYETRRQVMEIDNAILKSNIQIKSEDFLFFRNIVKDYRDFVGGKNLVNPNITIIFRDENGNIISGEIGRLAEYQEEIDFNSKNLDKIYDEEISNKFYYRGINFKISSQLEGNVRYAQLLINVDSERRLLNGYLQIIAYSIIIISGLSIIVSYVISRRNLEPLKESISKQMEFVQNVSHELRTPLTIIQAKQELLLQEPDAKIIDKSEDIVLTLNETKRLSRLVKDLLVLSRADNNKLTIQKESVNIDDYIKEIVTPYVEVAELEEKKIIFNLNYKTDIKIDTNKIY